MSLDADLLNEAAIQDATEVVGCELEQLTPPQRAEVLRRIASTGVLPEEEWMVKNARGEYWDLDERSDTPTSMRTGPDRWVKRQGHGCRFIERSNAVAVAARVKGRVIHMVPKRATPNGGTEP